MENNKTRAIEVAKNESLVLFSEKNMYRGLGDARNGYEEEIIRALNIDTSKPHDLYEEISKSGLTVSLYDLISWFNEQYNLIRDKAKDLPDLVLPVYKWEKDKEEKAHLIVTDIGHDSLHFRDLNESLVHEYMCRRYAIRKDKNGFKYSISLDGYGYYESEKLDTEKKELLQEYYALAQKFYDYIAAYSFFRATDTDNFKSTFNLKGVLGTAIFGSNPFNNLEQFFVHYGNGGNVDGYFFNYKLGERTISDPKIRFWDAHPEICTENRSDIINNPDVLAKTLRMRKSNLPFNINKQKN